MFGKRIIVAPMTGPNSLKQRDWRRERSLLKKTWRLCWALVATLTMSMFSPWAGQTAGVDAEYVVEVSIS